MPTEMELTLEQTQQGVSYEVSFDESNANVLERFYTSAGNPVKEILLKLNLPDHRSILTDSKEYIKMVMETSATLLPYVFLKRESDKVKESRKMHY
ncbi:hypothetical protein Tco_0862986 [Tanacetum coccineum]